MVMSAPEAAPISLFWVPNGLKELPEVHFKFFLQRDWQIDNDFFNTPLMVRTQILVHRWGPRTSILALFRRRT